MKPQVDNIYPYLTEKILQDERLYTFQRSKHGLYYGKLNGKLYARTFDSPESILKTVSNIRKLLKL